MLETSARCRARAVGVRSSIARFHRPTKGSNDEGRRTRKSPGIQVFSPDTYKCRKSELQAEVQSLRNQLQQAAFSEYHEPPVDFLSHGTLRNGGQLQLGLEEIDGSRSFSTEVDQFMSPPENSQKQYAIEQEQQCSSTPKTAEGSWAIGDLTVGQTEMQDCFNLFLQNYLPHQPVVDANLRPHECYNESTLLFWTIISIGSRRYAKDPTLVILLAPKVKELVGKAILSTDGSLCTIQAFLLLCAWPLPFDSLSRDYTPTVAGAVLSIAMTNGLHVLGVGQDFSRTKLPDDSRRTQLRTKLWSICIATCQRWSIGPSAMFMLLSLIKRYCRISAINGTPPIWIPDTYDRPSNRHAYDSVPGSVRFQKRLNQLHTEALFNVETQALPSPTTERDLRIVTMIEAWRLTRSTLEHECPTLVGKSEVVGRCAYKLTTADQFALTAATLQIQQFYLFLSRGQIDALKIQTLFATSCSLVELAMSLDQVQQFCDYAPLFLIKHLHLAAVLIMRLERSVARESLDVPRGKRCYFGIIQMHKKISVRADDFWARCSICFSQMWMSRKAYRKVDGTTDTLKLRCHSRLGMSVLYESYWWWRAEFTGEPLPFKDEDIDGKYSDSALSLNPDYYVPSLTFMTRRDHNIKWGNCRHSRHRVRSKLNGCGLVAISPDRFLIAIPGKHSHR
ncbi:uncharacterized protein A1O9_02596 [Exophiala aquamarina CBS 119918]|uniref:Transcription factor domain-containing protein n=1 Tax=Exophiala aquamarina CBS 119918 TaxID=1182545 RepID=A0A072PMN6_9EURO|nr:uncharacterized protein A1O9_02596 [Exophiala aquamarina CBS 119918]KEF61032.1 hypothetical protein A1O9_02596 [Exophiala aquamarina CBS 119918]